MVHFLATKYTMKLLKLAFVAALFYLLTPGMLVSLPPGASHRVQTAVHAVVFAVVLGFAWKLVKKSM